MIIKKRLFQITLTVVTFAILLVFGLFQVTKGARFHQLNFLHAKYTAELTALIPASHYVPIEDTREIMQALKNIRAQPLECLKLINTLDYFIAKLANLDKGAKLCKADLVEANWAIDAVKEFDNHKIPTKQFYNTLVSATYTFRMHSDQLEELAEKTVKVIIRSVLISSAVLGVLMFFLLVYLMRSISKTASQMQKTSKALEESEKKNRQLAHFDSLTGLPNRNLFIERLDCLFSLAKRHKQKLVLLFIDLDQFKNVNDSMGHHAGDDLICEASKRIAFCLRKNDTVSRIGGDEFTVILSDIGDRGTVEYVSKKILEQLAKPFNILGQEVFISGSIGIATYPDDTDNVNNLKTYADLAMYQAKNKGRNCFEYYSSELEEKINKKLYLEKQLRQALEREEFILYYQPVIDLTTMKTVSLEALIRWEHPDLGFIDPMDFIYIAEETGLIIEIGDWVLYEACRNLRAWRDDGNPDLKVAVNVSPRQLISENFLISVKNALALLELPPSALEIEITENILVEEDSVSTSILREISSLGVNLLLDDFGTGHSSLSYLHKFPFDILKLDRSFVAKLHSEQEGKANIIPSIIAMAHKLGLQVVAEGVETQDSLVSLKNLNCEYAQGYFISHPLPAEEINCSKVYHFDLPSRLRSL